MSKTLLKTYGSGVSGFGDGTSPTFTQPVIKAVSSTTSFFVIFDWGRIRKIIVSTGYTTTLQASLDTSIGYPNWDMSITLDEGTLFWRSSNQQLLCQIDQKPVHPVYK